MSEEQQLVWRRTNTGVEAGISIAGFTGLQIAAFGLSILIGFSVALLLKSDLGFPLLTSGLVGMSVPMVTALILMLLVVNRPKGYLENWLTWQVLKVTKGPLVRRNTLRKEEHS